MSAPEPSVALVFSPELWVEELHRHLSHHGGARVRQIVVEPSVALEEDYDVLVVSDRWPALTYGFVGRGARVRSRHSRRVRSGRTRGQGPPRRPRGRRHHRRPTPTSASSSPCCSRSTRPPRRASGGYGRASTGRGRPLTDAPSGVLVAVSGPRGSGVTEVALGIAVALAERHRSVVLLDAHEAAPAVAGRLGLGLEPNLRSAVDACAHGLGALDDCVVAVLEHGGGRLGAVAGHPSADRRVAGERPGRARRRGRGAAQSRVRGRRIWRNARRRRARVDRRRRRRRRRRCTRARSGWCARSSGRSAPSVMRDPRRCTSS